MKDCVKRAIYNWRATHVEKRLELGRKHSSTYYEKTAKVWRQVSREFRNILFYEHFPEIVLKKRGPKPKL